MKAAQRYRPEDVRAPWACPWCSHVFGHAIVDKVYLCVCGRRVAWHKPVSGACASLTMDDPDIVFPPPPALDAPLPLGARRLKPAECSCGEVFVAIVRTPMCPTCGESVLVDYEEGT